MSAQKARMPSYDAEDVKRYYENNTSLFLRLGQGVDGTIRRAVWGPGVASRAQAMAFVDELIIGRVQRVATRLGRTPRILDLGCGVAASLCRIAQRCDVQGTGVTISPAQVERARENVRRLGFGETLRIVEADFCNLPEELSDFDVAFAIESFVHAPEASKFFASAYSALGPGGVLVVCDDFSVRDPVDLTLGESRWLRRYCDGWKVSSVLGPSALEDLPERAGFSKPTSRDLTSYVETGRPRDYAIMMLVRSLSWLPFRGSYWSMLKGGDALQHCLKMGVLSYRYLTWDKPESA